MSPGTEEAQLQGLKTKLEQLQAKTYPPKLTYIAELRDFLVLLGWIQYYTLNSKFEESRNNRTTVITTLIQEVVRFVVIFIAALLAFKELK